MSQIQSVQTFADSGPNADVNGLRMNSHVNDATLLNGAVLDQTEKTTVLAADFVLLGDSAAAASAPPKKATVQNLFIQALRNGASSWGGTAGGTANALTLVTSPVNTGVYVAGEVIRFLTGAAANTGAVTINDNGRGAKNLFTATPTVSAMIGGELPAGTLVEAVYDGTQFQATLVNVTGLNSASYAAGGGTANAQTVTLAPVPSAATIKAGWMVRFKASATNTGACTLNPNGTGALTIKKTVAGAIADLAANDIQTTDLVTLVHDGTNLLLVGKARSWDFIGTGAVPGGTSKLTIAHGLGGLPTKVRAVLLQNTAAAQQGYAQNTELELGNANDNSVSASNTQAFQVSTNATSIEISSSQNTPPKIIPNAGGAITAITSANWLVKVYASL